MPFRPLRKKKHKVPLDDAKKLLHEARRGVLAVNGDDGYPYAFPINYYYDEPAGKLYFHGGHVGHKVDALRKSDKICFTVYGNETVRDEAWAPYLQSVVVFGRCRLLPDGDDSVALLKRFALKYYPSEALVDEAIAASRVPAQMYEITIEHLTGKQAQER